MSVEITAVYTGNLKCRAKHGPSGAELVTEAPKDNGGNGEEFSPTDLVGTALGTCVMTIIGLVGARHEVDLTGLSVRVTKEMVADPIRRIGKLTTVVTLPASSVPEKSMRDRLEAAARKCPVHASLHPEIDAPIDFVYQ